MNRHNFFQFLFKIYILSLSIILRLSFLKTVYFVVFARFIYIWYYYRQYIYFFLSSIQELNVSLYYILTLSNCSHLLFLIGLFSTKTAISGIYRDQLSFGYQKITETILRFAFPVPVFIETKQFQAKLCFDSVSRACKQTDVLDRLFHTNITQNCRLNVNLVNYKYPLYIF